MVDNVQPLPVKNVLVVFPYHAELPASALSEKVLRREIGGLIDMTVNLYVEYLDLLRFPAPEHRKAAVGFLNDKYRALRIDSVLLATKQGLDMWTSREISLAPGAPAVFFDVNEQVMDEKALPPNVYGVVATVDYRPTVDWLSSLRKPVRELALVYGTGPIDEAFSAPVEELLPYLGDKKIVFTDLSNRSFDEMLAYVSRMRPGSAVLYHLLFMDASGERHWPLDALRQLALRSAVPVVVGHDQFVGQGALGGYTYSIEMQTAEAVRLSLKLLRGEAPRQGTVIAGKGNRFVFDHALARRYGFRVADLPSSALLKNRRVSFGELYSREVAGAAALIIVLTLLVVVLAEQKRRLRRARLDLAELNADLEAQVSLRTADLSSANHQLREEIAERTRAERSLSEALAERGMLLKELNHRIKNNLQIVLSLIKMSSSGESTEEAKVLNEAAGRIEAIANVHESFDPEDRALVVALDEYLMRLSADADQMHAGDSGVSIETLTSSGVSVSMKTAASIGLIVNELLTNAFKYAYPAPRGGSIRLSASRSSEGSVIVEVADEGVGMEAGLAVRAGSLGMSIVRSLAEGLGARLELDSASGKGTKWTLSLPQNILARG